MSVPAERLGPHDFAAEIAILATCLRGEKTAYFETVAQGVRAEDFLRESHGAIFSAIGKVAGEGIHPDAVTVGAVLDAERTDDGESRLQAIGGRERLDDLVGEEIRPENLGEYARIVREKALARGLLRALNETTRSVADGVGFDEALSGYEAAAEQLRERSTVRRSVKTGVDLAARFNAKRLNPPTEEEDGVLAPYDLPRWRRGSLYTIAGYTGFGKTVVGTDALGVACKADTRVGLASLEMTGDEVLERLVAKFGVPYSQAQTGRIDAKYVGAAEKAEAAIASWNFDVLDDEEVDPAKLRRWATAGKYDLVIVDHLHRIEFADRFEIEKTVRSIRNLAKRLEIPILLLAQLSRAADKKNPFPRPTLPYLRETAVVEHESAAVLFIHRETDEETHEPTNAAEIYAGKARFGDPKSFYRRLTFHGERQTFAHSSHTR